MAAPSPEDLPIERQDGIENGRYVLRLEDGEAEMTYAHAGDCVIVIDHTEVPEAMRGRSVGQALVERTVADARAEGRTIVPLCPFVKAQMDRHSDWQDVLKT